MSRRKLRPASPAYHFRDQARAYRAEYLGSSAAIAVMNDPVPDVVVNTALRGSLADAFLRQSLARVIHALDESPEGEPSVSQSVPYTKVLNPSLIVQQLIEHRLALPYSAALTEFDRSSTSATTVLLKLASQLQDRHQPIANEAILGRVLNALASVGVATLVIKGAAYSRAFYPEPTLRRSTDHDILVAPESRKAAHETLISIGFKPTSANVFQVICGQASYRTCIAGKTIEVDLHWELGNNFALYQKFDFKTLIDTAVRVDFAGFHALRMNDSFCALHCALNYCSDHPKQRSFLALLDLALITRDFSELQTLKVFELALATQTLAVLQFALAEAERLFGIVLLELPSMQRRADDPLLKSLECRFRRSELWWPITTPRSIAAKLKFLWFQALPPKAYMYARYSGNKSLLNLHFKRLVHAIRSVRQPRLT